MMDRRRFKEHGADAMMDRRAFISGFAGAALLSPVAASAQSPPKTVPAAADLLVRARREQRSTRS
jgi:hypothetical protein